MDDLFLLEDCLWILNRPTGLGIYDFAFDRFFACRRPWQRPERIVAVSRRGPFSNYDEESLQLIADGVVLVNSPDNYRIASELTEWYLSLLDLTPRSLWKVRKEQDGKEVDAHFIGDELGWPVFVKGSRQTSRHRADLCVAKNADELQNICQLSAVDPILSWQTLVYREFVPLRKVADAQSGQLPTSFEFRTFWWRNELVGVGPYWIDRAKYDWTEPERADGLKVAGEAARRLNVPFLVVDIAQTFAGRWIVIECNDGQESGYAGVSPFALWNNILLAEARAVGY